METRGGRSRMKPEVALAVLEREGCWLLQLRDDDVKIVYPGQWGLFGGHLEPGELADEAVKRELDEEIGWWPKEPLQHWFSHESDRRIAHIYRGKLNVPIDELSLKEGQELQLVTLEEINSGKIWSHERQEMRPVVDGLMIVYERWMQTHNG